MAADHAADARMTGELQHQFGAHGGIGMGGGVGRHVEGVGEQTVAGEDGGRLVVGLVRRRAAAPQVVVVHRRQVVVDERVAMDHLERAGGAQHTVATWTFTRDAEQARALDHQERTQPLAAAERGVAHRLHEAGGPGDLAGQRRVGEKRLEHPLGRLGDGGQPRLKIAALGRTHHVLQVLQSWASLARSGWTGQVCRSGARWSRPRSRRPPCSGRRLAPLGCGMAVRRRRRSISRPTRGAALSWPVVALVLLVFLGLLVLDTLAPPDLDADDRPASSRASPIERRWVPLKAIAPVLVASVIASEDSRFCRNDGVDWGSLNQVIGEADADGPSRGASTITMQTAKNLFLWPGRSAVRKGIEIAIALGLDKVWTKAHTIEVYLNIAEWGDGLFGIEAAAQRYFHKSASQASTRARRRCWRPRCRTRSNATRSRPRAVPATARRQPRRPGARQRGMARLPAEALTRVNLA